MVVINKSERPLYSTLAHRMLNPGQRSADLDTSGLRKALESVLKSCGSSCVVRLSGREAEMISRLLELDAAGWSYRREQTDEKSQFDKLMEADAAAKKELSDSVGKAIAEQEAIMSETTYASRKDVAAARSAADSIKGDVKAKKLAGTGGTPVSLGDLLSDNKFIEENMKNSGIKMTLASEEGWDTGKMSADAQDGENKTEDIAARGESAVEPAEAPAEEPVAPQKKKRTRRG